eukprot:9027188-Alexandrium_andersonii.AAC.1
MLRVTSMPPRALRSLSPALATTSRFSQGDHTIPLVCALALARHALMMATLSTHLYIGWTDLQCVAQ